MLRSITCGPGLRPLRVILLSEILTIMHDEFQFLDLRERANLILTEGQHLITTNFYGAAVKLYHHKNQYIEIYHHPVTRKIMRVSLATNEDLKKHVKDLQLGL